MKKSGFQSFIIPLILFAGGILFLLYQIFLNRDTDLGHLLYALIFLPALIAALIIALRSEGRATDERRDIRSSLMSLSGTMNSSRSDRETLQIIGSLEEEFESLRLEKDLFQSLLNALKEGVVCIRSSGEILYQNHSLPTQLIQKGSRGVSYVRALPNADFLDFVHRRLKGHPLSPDELARGTILESDGSISRFQLDVGDAHYTISYAPIRKETDSTPSIHLFVIRDVTEAAGLARMRREFLQNAGHELKTPITSIRGYAETLLERMESDRSSDRNETDLKFLRAVVRNAIRLQNLVEDLNLLSAAESGDYNFQAKRIDLKALITDVRLLLEGRFREKNQDLAIDIPHEAGIYGDPLLLEHLLINLLVNASNYAPENSRITLEISTADTNQTLIRLIDQGPGIPPEFQEKIFKRFFRMDSARTRHAGGTGLGLSIVRHIARLHGGEISVHNAAMGGAVFEVLLPSEKKS